MNDRIVMPLWTFGLFIVVMNTTMFNVSTPSIIGDLHISADLGSWIISSYSIGYALSTVIYSRLSDVYSLRRLLTVGLLTLGLSSVFGLFAHSFHALLAARICQSAGAGAMAGLGLIIAARYIPIERRGSAIAMISAGSAMAFGLGPIVGGLISEYMGWNGLFAITCLVLVILPVLLRLLPKEVLTKDTQFDVFGAMWTICNAASLLLAVTQRSIGWLAISILSFLFHAWHMKRSKNSFINPVLMRNPAYGKLLVIGFCLLVMNLGNLFLMPLVLANLSHQSAMMIGLTIAPGAILSAFLTRYVGRWIDRYGNLRFLFIGHSLLALVMIAFYYGINASPIPILVGYLCFSPAFSATMASLNNETSRILPKTLIGSGMGLMQLIQFFGGSISVAVCGILLAFHKKDILVHAYQDVYGLLFVISLCSLVMLFWYNYQAKEDTSRSLKSEGV
ncbi:MFS transporter [Paenibacillus sp. N3.4]|uniref:MFS transporter n=1 Tax=Paenibacillus sp. N3.4 TaxID=2603222 RepID=UPI0011C8F37C|nr:MFS transporter [Paenibacillus sp. N3.4]TXK84785.1 multidrug efflux MFS transporter [Paenibacillus sp. N3.4]